MGDYFKSLDPLAKKRDVEKLHLLVSECQMTLMQRETAILKFEKHDLPRSLAKKNWIWTCQDLPRRIEYGHVFFFFIARSGLYTRRQLMQWKSLIAYNYFQSGHMKAACTNLVFTTHQYFEDTCQSKPKCPTSCRGCCQKPGKQRLREGRKKRLGLGS